MSSKRMIDQLVGELVPVRQRSIGREGLLLVLLGAVEIGIFFALGYTRPDIGAAIALPSFWWKLGSLGVLSIVGAVVALRSFDPADFPQRGLRLIGMLIVATLAVGALIDLAGPNRGRLSDRLMWRHGIDCVVAMATLSIPPIVALGFLMRRGAPTKLQSSALAVGAASAAWGAFVFVLNCPHDDPLYIMVWYMIGCAIVALAGRLILPRMAHW